MLGYGATIRSKLKAMHHTQLQLPNPKHNDYFYILHSSFYILRFLRAGQRSGKSAQSVRSVFPYCQLCLKKATFSLSFWRPKRTKSASPCKVRRSCLCMQEWHDCHGYSQVQGLAFSGCGVSCCIGFLSFGGFYLKLRCSWPAVTLPRIYILQFPTAKHRPINVETLSKLNNSPYFYTL
jgi:hypothetical protein